MSQIPPDILAMIDRYAAGPKLLRHVVRDLSDAQWRTRAAPGRWSPLEVVAHIADFELVYADRLKRVVAENNPTLFGGNPDDFAAKLHYQSRDPAEELALVEATRSHVVRFLKTLSAADFDRTGNHSDDGPLTLRELLRRISGHITHHATFLESKRASLFD